MSIGGSILTFQYDGRNYEVDSDADFSAQAPREVEGKPTSGKTLIIIKKKVPEVQSVDLIVDSVDKQILTESFGAKSCSYTQTDGTVNSGEAWLNIDSTSTQENKMSLTIIPVSKFSVFPP